MPTGFTLLHFNFRPLHSARQRKYEGNTKENTLSDVEELLNDDLIPTLTFEFRATALRDVMNNNVKVVKLGAL